MKVCKFEKIKDEDEMKQVNQLYSERTSLCSCSPYIGTITGVVTGYFHQLVSRRR
mgnify:CR=1 FL=1